MRVFRYYAPEDLRLEQVPVPEPGAGELLLRVRNCATCGTDVKIYFHGHRNLKPPRVIGHEIAGEVAALGDGVDEFSVGDRVQVIAAVPCGECRECRIGHQNICENLTAIGYDYDGGYAEYLIVPELVLRVDGVNPMPARHGVRGGRNGGAARVRAQRPGAGTGGRGRRRGDHRRAGRSAACTRAWPVPAALRGSRSWSGAPSASSLPLRV